MPTISILALGICAGIATSLPMLSKIGLSGQPSNSGGPTALQTIAWSGLASVVVAVVIAFASYKVLGRSPNRKVLMLAVALPIYWLGLGVTAKAVPAFWAYSAPSLLERCLVVAVVTLCLVLAFSKPGVRP